MLAGPSVPTRTLAAGPRTLSPLVWLTATLATTFHLLDLLTGIRMMQVYGIELEQNPIARTIFTSGGPIGLAIAKLGVVLGGVCVLVLLARAGRTRLALSALLAVALLGLLGFASNLV
jgi:hypothetical protein